VATDHKRHQALETRGLFAIDSDDYLDILYQALASHPPAVFCALNADWQRLVSQPPTPAESVFYAEVLGDLVLAAATPGAPDTSPALADMLHHTPAAQRLSVITDFITASAARVLGLEGGQALDVDLPLIEQGFDSLMAVELRNRLGKGIGASLPVALTFNHPTIRDLADYLEDQTSQEQPRQPTVASATTAEDFNYLDQLSPEELEAVINKDLNQRLDADGTPPPRRNDNA